MTRIRRLSASALFLLCFIILAAREDDIKNAFVRAFLPQRQRPVSFVKSRQRAGGAHQQPPFATVALSLSSSNNQDDEVQNTSSNRSVSSSSSSDSSAASRNTSSGGGLLSNTNTSFRHNSSSRRRRQRRAQQRDVLIVGGALAGLSTALYLSEMDPSRHITILDRHDYYYGGQAASKERTSTESATSNKNAPPASFAAAGMLAPNSERLPPGPLLDLCRASRRMFPEFCDWVETLAQESGEFGNEFGAKENDSNNLDPWSVGYVASGGFLAPAFAGDAVATWAPPPPPDDNNDSEGDSADDSKNAAGVWLDATQARELEPSLHPDVVGAWWFPDDASVDARRLTRSLRAACIAAGVQVLSGASYEVSSLDLVDGKCQGLWLQSSSSRKNKSGPRYMGANTVLIANGAWMRQLLPVPIEPHKGQSLSLRMPPDQPPLLRRVLFAQDSYIVPKADGRIVVGATVEAGSFNPHVTPAGLLHIMTHALQLVPGLKDLPVEETWVGLRPTTPDKGPILGKTPWDNLFVAGGYWRNGVLLAPKTGQLLASLIISSSSKNQSGSEEVLSPQDSEFLEAFAWDRFTNAAKSSALAANARYAASMHPIHRRSSTGVAAAVGTELGSYSSARSAAEERQQDRNALRKSENDGGDNNDDDDAAFERAAAMGKQDATAYTFGDNNESKEQQFSKDESSALLHKPLQKSNGKADSSAISKTPSFFEGSADAITVGAASTSSEIDESDRLDDEPVLDDDTKEEENKLEAVYRTIQENKAKQTNTLVNDDNEEEEDRPDPGFRIYHVDSDTGEIREVPPYTTTVDFLASIAHKEATLQSLQSSEAESETTSNGASSRGDDNGSDYSETTFDGYQDIQQSNKRATRHEELEAMRKARQSNRLGQDTIDPSKIGAQRSEDNPIL